MKKFLLSIVMLFMFVTVNASTKTTVKNIKIENIKVEVKENVGYNEELKINYSINPRDAKNLNLSWNVLGLKKGITVEFVNGKTTKDADGVVALKINNTLNEKVNLTLTGSQNGKVLVSSKFTVETKDKTEKRVTNELNDLITNLDEKLNNKNYEENKEAVEKIDELLKNNSELKDKISSDLLTKYNTVKENVEGYKPNNKGVVIGVSAGLAAAFSGLLYWIFKKEDN